MSKSSVAEPLRVGGQAVMEGVMMRSPNSFAVAVRRSNGKIVVREAPWRPLLGGWRFLRWPFVRGAVVLLESMANGISALNFSAKIAMEDMQEQEREEKAKERTQQEQGDAQDTEREAGATEQESSEPSDWAIWGTVIFALALGIAMFVALPHMAVWLGSKLLGRELTVEEISFHVIEGVVKMAIFLGYLGLISLMKDVRRVFMYHGAEHQSIYAFEAGQALVVESARQHKPLHPRCGTTFLIMVIALSILIFSLAFPALIYLVGKPTGIAWLDNIIYILIKLPLLFPIAGLAYEFQRFTSRYLDRWWAKALAWPGMFVQRLTTRPPTDDQLEVALASLHKALWRERVGVNEETKNQVQVETFDSFEQLVQSLKLAA